MLAKILTGGVELPANHVELTPAVLIDRLLQKMAATGRASYEETDTLIHYVQVLRRMRASS